MPALRHRTTSFLLLLVCGLAVAGCGGGHKLVAGHSCDPNNYVMQCALTAPPHGLLGIAPGTPGIDFGWSGISASRARALGARFGASYLSTDGSKNWTRALVNSYHAAGIATVNVWETTANRALSGFAGGRADAQRALAQSMALGTGDRPIYFAIDFDETAGQAGAVASYFQGAGSALANAGPVSFPHSVGVGAYGGYWAVKRLFDAHLIQYGWQTYAWSGGLWDGRAQLRQVLNGSSFDYDRALAADYGQSPAPGPLLPVCFTHRISKAACANVKRQIAHDQRAAASSSRAFKARKCDVLTARERWFASAIRRQPHSSRLAYRKGALAATRHAEQRQQCGLFSGRMNFYADRVNRAKASN